MTNEGFRDTMKEITPKLASAIESGLRAIAQAIRDAALIGSGAVDARGTHHVLTQDHNR